VTNSNSKGRLGRVEIAAFMVGARAKGEKGGRGRGENNTPA